MSEKKETSAVKETLKGFFWALLIGLIGTVLIDIYNQEMFYQDYWFAKLLVAGLVVGVLSLVVTVFAKDKVKAMVVAAFVFGFLLFIGGTGILS